jgi:hypothetical protein
LPSLFEDHGIEFGAGQECQQDGADAGQKFDPTLIAAEYRHPKRGAEDELRRRTDANFGERGRNPEPKRQQARDQRQCYPQRE